MLLYHTVCYGCCVGGNCVAISHCMLQVLCWWKLCCHNTLYVIGDVWMEVMLYHTACCGCCVGGSCGDITHCMLRMMFGWTLCCYITLYVTGAVWVEVALS